MHQKHKAARLAIVPMMLGGFRAFFAVVKFLFDFSCHSYSPCTIRVITADFLEGHVKETAVSPQCPHNANGNRRRSVSGGNQKRHAFGVRLTAWLHCDSIVLAILSILRTTVYGLPTQLLSYSLASQIVICDENLNGLQIDLGR